MEFYGAWDCCELVWDSYVFDPLDNESFTLTVSAQKGSGVELSDQYSVGGVWVDPSVNASKNLTEAQVIDQELGNPKQIFYLLIEFIHTSNLGRVRERFSLLK